MERSEIPHDPRHLGVPSGASKMISEPMVRSTHTGHLSCIKIKTISKWTELSLEPRHLRVLSGSSKTISELMVRFAQIVHLSCTDTKTALIRKKWDSTWLTSPRSSIGCVQNNLWPYGTFTQTVHLSCVKISTISERTKMRFHLSIVT
jgi:hypothetical protein